MGNYKFRFSDMIPNAWFHKLKDMNKPRSKTLIPTNKKHSSPPPPTHASEFTKPHLSDQRKSYYFTRDLTIQSHPHKSNLAVEPPRKSSRQRRRRSTKRNPPRLVSTACRCSSIIDNSPPPPPEETTSSGHDTHEQSSSLSEPDSVLTELGSDREPDNPSSWSSPCKCNDTKDIVINIINDGDHRRLPPIITKKNRTSTELTERNEYKSLSVKVVKEEFSPARRSSAGVKLRMNSPKIVNRRIQGRRSGSSSSSSTSRRSLSESLAVVKRSKNPSRDFKESMMEMIVENNIKASKDLEELLACYLTLNSDEYHDLIINVFKQIWFDFIHLRLK